MTLTLRIAITRGQRLSRAEAWLPGFPLPLRLAKFGFQMWHSLLAVVLESFFQQPLKAAPQGLLRCSLGHVDGSAALQGAASAGHLLDFLVEMVVNGELFALPDWPERHVNDVPFHDPRHEIGLARVIDILRSGPAHRAVQGPVAIQGEHVRQLALLGSSLGLTPADAFAGVFDYLPSRWNRLTGVDSPPVNLRGSQFQAKTG